MKNVQLTQSACRLRKYRKYVMPLQTSRPSLQAWKASSSINLAEQFVEFYYKTFDTDRQQLASLYVSSQYFKFLRTWRALTQTGSAINLCWRLRTNQRKALLPSFRSCRSVIRHSFRRKAQLSWPQIAQELPFQKVAHRVDSLDAQPAAENGSVVVLVTGALLVWSHKPWLKLWLRWIDVGNRWTMNNALCHIRRCSTWSLKEALCSCWMISSA